MKQEEKELLIKDLCGRLPYGTMVYAQNAVDWYDSEICTQVLSDVINEDYIVKPYLFPLSSMTEEQKYDFYCRFIANDCDFDDFKEFYLDNGMWHKMLTSIDDCDSVVDWFCKNHFDYKGLIPKGLSIDATGLNIY